MPLKETELAQHFIDNYLKDGYDIYKEVPCAGIIDIIYTNSNIITAVEAKTTLSFDVIEQAIKNKSYAHYSYILVPNAKSRWFAYKICEDYGIGVLTIGNYNGRLSNVWEQVKPKLNRKISRPKLEDWQKLNTAGVQSGRITAFSNTVTEITNHLKRQPLKKALVKDVLFAIKHHYGSNTSANSSLMNMCRRGVIKDFKFEKGYMTLTAQHQCES